MNTYVLNIKMRKLITLLIFLFMIVSLIFANKCSSTKNKTTYHHHPTYYKYVHSERLAIKKNIT